MNSNEKVKIEIFGKERILDILLVGDNEPEYDLITKQMKVVKLTEKEEQLLNWIQAVDFDLYKDKIVKYINYLNDMIGEDTHDDYDLSDNDIFLPVQILINVTSSMDEDTADIALFAESDAYAMDDGIMIAFKDGEYFGISGFNDCLNYFEDFE